MYIIRWAAILMMTCWVAFADDAASRAKLIGTWQVEASSSGAASVWSLADKGDAIRITLSEGDQKIAEFECSTVGKECTIKDSGREAKVSLWYNGPKLVEMETRGNEVIKRRFSVAEGGDTMELELIPIAPAGKTEKLHFKRAAAPAGH